MISEWVMWARRGGSWHGLEFHGLAATRTAVNRDGRDGDVVPVRVVEDPDGLYVGWVESDRMPEAVMDFQPRSEPGLTRLRIEGLRGDLDDTSNCPVGLVCAGCGFPGPSLQVEIAATQVGVMCVTTCDDCHDDGLEPLSVVAAMDRAALHCGHLGITLDEMAALMESERD